MKKHYYPILDIPDNHKVRVELKEHVIWDTAYCIQNSTLTIQPFLYYRNIDDLMDAYTEIIKKKLAKKKDLSIWKLSK